MAVIPLRMKPAMKTRIEQVTGRYIQLGWPGTSQADVIRKCLDRGLTMVEEELDDLERRKA